MDQRGDSGFLSRRGAAHRMAVVLAVVLGIAAIATVSTGTFLLVRRQAELKAQNEEMSRALAEANQSREQAEAQRTATEVVAYRDALRLADECIKGFQAERAREALENAPRSLRNWEWGYLKRKLALPARVFQGHTKGVSHVEFSPDNTKLVTASADGTAIVWDLQTRDVLLHLKGHIAGVATAWLTEDGRRVVTESYDGTSRVWDAQTGQCERTLPVNPEALFRLRANSGTVRFVTRTDWEALLWDVHSTEPVRRFEVNKMRLKSAWMSPSGEQVVLLLNNGRLCVFDANSGDLLLTTDGEQATFSEDGMQFFIREKYRTSIWNTTTWERMKKELPKDADMDWQEESSSKPEIALNNHRRRSTFEQHYVYSPDLQYVAGFDGRALTIRDTITNEESIRIDTKSDPLRTVCWNPAGSALLGVTKSGVVTVWDGSTGSPIASLVDDRSTCPSSTAYFTTDGQGIVTHTATENPQGDCAADTLWDVSVLEAPRVRFRAGFAHYFVATTGNTISSRELIQRYSGDPLWYQESWKALEEIFDLGSAYADRYPLASAVNPTGDRAIAVFKDGAPGIWDIQNKQLLDPLYMSAKPWATLDWSRDGRWIASGGSDGAARVWPAEPNAPCTDVWPEETEDLRARYAFDSTLYPLNMLWAMQHPEDMDSEAWRQLTSEDVVTVAAAAVSPSGKQVAVAGSDGSLSWWDLDLGQRLHWFRDPSAPIVSVEFGSDGATIVFTYADGNAQACDVVSGQRIGGLPADARAGDAIGNDRTQDSSQLRCASPDGTREFSLSRDGTLKVCDGKNGAELLSIPVPANVIAAFGIDADGQRLVIVYRDFTVRTVDAEPWDT
ncbi:MAG: WD40 repeat domain-containing protein [Candidatus Hydrogenedentes bacterium]|nr:WD40 repeat domain-containing protein [Candidatus Hydrogenedentota bacterium]